VSLTPTLLDEFLSAGATAEQIVKLVKADMADRERGTRLRRTKDSERQRRHRKSRAVTVTNGESHTPPKENKSNPPNSEANASDRHAADPVKQLFDLGVELLTSAGQTEKQARSLLGMWRKSKSDGEVINALIECRAKAISDPVGWLAKRLQIARYVSASGHEYRGDFDAVIREAERRCDWNIYWLASRDRKQESKTGS
jgi:hypothetical protein